MAVQGHGARPQIINAGIARRRARTGCIQNDMAIGFDVIRLAVFHSHFHTVGPQFYITLTDDHVARINTNLGFEIAGKTVSRNGNGRIGIALAQLDAAVRRKGGTGCAKRKRRANSNSRHKKCRLHFFFP